MRRAKRRGSVYNVVDLGEKLVDPDTTRVLGYHGIYVGQGRVDRAGDPVDGASAREQREALTGDYLLPEQDVTPANFIPHPPAKEVDGRIIAVLSGVSLIGQYKVVVLNRGTKHGLDPGTVLRVYQTGKDVRDDGGGMGSGQGGKNGREHGIFSKKVRLPDEPAGTMMVFRTFDRMSYALIMEATTATSACSTRPATRKHRSTTFHRARRAAAHAMASDAWLDAAARRAGAAAAAGSRR